MKKIKHTNNALGPFCELAFYHGPGSGELEKDIIDRLVRAPTVLFNRIRVRPDGL